MSAPPQRPAIPRVGLLEHAELYIYLATAVVLVLAAAGLLIFAVVEMAQSILAGDYIDSLLNLLDRALLVLMIAEITFTVRQIAQRQRIEAEPFFIVAIIAAIRRMLIITAESAGHADLSDPAFQAVLAELGLLALIILALAWAMRIIPARQENRSD